MTLMHASHESLDYHLHDMNELKTLEAFTVAELRLFSRVVALQSFTAAAREARVSQPSVSRLVAHLEERLGGPVVVRTTRRVMPTTLGERLVEALAPVLARFSAPAPTRGAGLEGALRVAAPGAFGRTFVAPVVNQFLKEHPRVELELLLGERRVDLVQQRVDVAVRIGAVSPGLRARTLGASEPVLVCAPTLMPPQPLTNLVELASALPLVMARVDDPASLKSLEVDLKRLRPRLVCDDFDALFEAVVGGVGFTLLPRWRVQRALEDGVLVRLLPSLALPPAPVRAVFPGTAKPGRLARAFVERLAASLPPTLRPSR